MAKVMTIGTQMKKLTAPEFAEAVGKARSKAGGRLKAYAPEDAAAKRDREKADEHRDRRLDMLLVTR